MIKLFALIQSTRLNEMQCWNYCGIICIGYIPEHSCHHISYNRHRNFITLIYKWKYIYLLNSLNCCMIYSTFHGRIGYVRVISHCACPGFVLIVMILYSNCIRLYHCVPRASVTTAQCQRELIYMHVCSVSYNNLTVVSLTVTYSL